jgi:4-amino-4-deoxy-L-arabinose transferase-like glycosyltransferase
MDHRKSVQIMWALALGAFLFNLVISHLSQFGIFRDELYYIACANHPDLGYVDHPPLSVWILAVWKSIFGDSLFSLRFLPALFAGLTAAASARLTRELEGGIYAQTLAGVLVTVTPIYLGFFGIYSMNALDVLLWALAFIVLLQLVRTGRKKDWYLLGLIIGLGALNKISMLWLAAGIASGILLTPLRASLKKREPWLACLIIILLFLPFVLWNATHDFAHLEFIRNASGEKYASQNPITFLTGIFFNLNPLAVIIWLGGFYHLLRRRDARPAGIAVTVVLLILLANYHTKSEYFSSAAIVLLPAGVALLDTVCSHGVRRWLMKAYLAIVVLSGLALLPATRDVLPLDDYLRYQEKLHINTQSVEGLETAALPQFYADRMGWENMARVVAGIYATLPEADKRRCLVYGRNYGEAGAIDYFRRTFDLPPAISQHNSYYYWSQKLLSADIILIVIGRNIDDLRRDFDQVDIAGEISAPYVMPYEDHLTVTICRGLRIPPGVAWAQGKDFI